MKLRVALIGIILCFFSLNLVEVKSVDKYQSQFMFLLGNTNAKLIQNGVKLQYSESIAANEEIKYIASCLNLDKSLIDNLQKDSYQINTLQDNIDLKVNVEEEKGISYIEIESISNSNVDKIDKLKIYLQKVLKPTCENVQYFTFVKGKISGQDKDECIYKVSRELKNLGATKVNYLPINSGFTGVAKFDNNSTLNFAICQYMSETYLIIGTPIIFTTY